MTDLTITATRTTAAYTVATLSDGREIGAKTVRIRNAGSVVDVCFLDIADSRRGEHITLRTGTSHQRALAQALDQLNNPPKRVHLPRRKPTPAPAPKRLPVKELVSGEGFLWLGTSHRLKLVDDGAPIRIDEPHRHQDWLRLRRDAATADTIIGWYQAHGLDYARQVANYWMPRMSLHDIQVKVRSLTNKWGTARRNTITLHWAVFQLPRPLVEYVIVHELAHVADASGRSPHGPAWRRIIDRCLLDRAERERELSAREADIWQGDVATTLERST